MASTVELATPAHLVWTTEKPYDDCPRESPVFMLKDSLYSLELVYDVNDWYLLYLRNTIMGAVPLPSSILVSLADESNSIMHQSCNTYSDTSQYIWTATIPDMARELPRFHSRHSLSFRITFHDIPGSMLHLEPKTNDKYVQTPSYLDVHSHFQDLSRDFQELLDGSSSHDVEFKIGDHTLKAHRNVLSTRSEVLSAMFESDMVEGQTGLVEIQDVEADTFRQFLRYLYCGALPELTVDTAKRFYEAGDKYAVDDLKKRCASFLKEHLTQENACSLLALADQHSDPDFRESVIRYILDQKLPLHDEHWTVFCDHNPRLAILVLNRFCKLREGNCPE